MKKNFTLHFGKTLLIKLHFCKLKSVYDIETEVMEGQDGSHRLKGQRGYLPSSLSICTCWYQERTKAVRSESALPVVWGI